MRRSRRLQEDLSPSDVSRRLAAAGPRAIDLTGTNPTIVGLEYPAAAIRAALAPPEVLRYRPAPLGLPEARQAIAARVGCAAEDVVVTASTSESYALLFKLLADPGERIAVPVPSYPLLESLARLEGLEVEPYRWTYEGRWRLDLDDLARAVAAGVRAVVVVSPNNPTGCCPSPDEIDALREVCGGAGVPLICDEVFRPYGFGAGELPTFGGARQGPLTFVLDGLSKRAALPQLKLGWMELGGPAGERGAARDALEIVCDTYLSVSAGVQLGAAELLAAGAGVARQLRERLQHNRRALAAGLAAVPAVSLLHADGGFCAVLRLPRVHSDAEWVLHLAETHGVIVQPGYWYDFDQEAHVVLSLLQEPGTFATGLERLVEGLASSL